MKLSSQKTGLLDQTRLDEALERKAVSKLAQIELSIDKKQFKEAESEFKALIHEVSEYDALRPKLVKTGRVLLQQFRVEAKPQQIIDGFQYASHLLESDPEALILTGWAFAQLKNYQKSSHLLEKAIILSPQNPEPYLLLGEIIEAEDSQNAIRQYARFHDYSSAPFAPKILVKKIRSLIKNSKEKLKFKTLRTAVIGNITLQPIKPYLEAVCLKAGIDPEIFFGGYDFYVHEMADPESELYRFDPHLTFLFLDEKTLLPELYTAFFEIPPNRRFELVATKMDQVKALTEKFLDGSTSLLIIGDFISPRQTCLGIYDTREVGGEKAIIHALNCHLGNWLNAMPNRLFRLDTEKVLSDCGKATVADEKMRYLAKMIVPEKALPKMAKEMMRFIRPAMGLTKKCLVLDLDNTLWGGVLGEDGIGGIQLGIEPPGNAFYEFQKAIKSLQKRGIILAINSKNDFDLVKEAFEKHPDMQLALKDFACIRTNWNDKAQNMREIAQELNLGLDSFVYIDDHPAERLLIQQQLPEVWTVDMPEDFSNYTQTLLDLDAFEILHLTDEDRTRTRLYQAESQRRELKTQITDLEEYLKSLAIKVEVGLANTFTSPRIAQLTQRTNQFNLTTRRYQEADIKNFAGSANYRVYFVHSSDRFGDHGIVGVAIIRVDGPVWEFDTFLMSCRVIGRGIEQGLLYFISQQATEGAAQKLIGRYRPTPKNGLAADFYSRENFDTVSQAEDETIYEFDLKTKIVPLPEYIQLKKTDER